MNNHKVSPPRRCSHFVYSIGTTTPNPRKVLFKTTLNPRKVHFKSTPDKWNLVLVGESIKLEWEFYALSNLSRIRLFKYDLRSKSKTTIASKKVKAGPIVYDPRFPEYQKRYVCNISLYENGFGEASILIQNVQFNPTYDYGIILQWPKKHMPSKENSVSLKVVGKWE